MIAVDVMSGEKPPELIIRGALRGALDFNVKVNLVGDKEYITSCLKKFKFEDMEKVEVHHASEVIAMHEIPTIACKKKKDASINVCTRLVKEGKAEGIFSPGNTGATLVSTFMNIGRIPGILRPAMITFMPTIKGPSLLIDAGANMDCTPEYLAQFAVMGEVFANKVQQKKNPSVGILSIGVERSKGNEVTLKTYDMLKDLDLNFVGNIEGYDVHNGDVDVVICDGFVGNIVVKITESLFRVTIELMGQEIGSHLLQRIGYAMIYPAVRKLNTKIDPREYGGAPLVGLTGNVVIGHGSSDDISSYNGIRLVNMLMKNKVNDMIVQRLQKLGLFYKRQTLSEKTKDKSEKS